MVASRITMNDIAREAGCSQTTVSFVLNGESRAHISAETRRRVIEAAAALGYRPRRRGTPAKRRPRPLPTPVDSGPPAANPARDNARGSRSRTAHVANEIGLRIIAGVYPEGGLLPAEADLMAQFKVSRTVLREAMKTLSGKGLLQAKSRIGTRVRPRPDWQVFDPDVLRWQANVGFSGDLLGALGEVRLIVEVEAAALAARRRTAEHLPGLYAWVERMAAAGRSRHDFVDADLNFHLYLGRIAGNAFLSALSSLIEVALIAALTKSSPVDEPGGVARSAAEHRAVVDAIAAGDEARARATMRHVIEEGIRRAGAEPPRQ
jgi:DNA-binding FadR family transcriptional regulator